jgi:protein TonB
MTNIITLLGLFLSFLTFAQEQQVQTTQLNELLMVEKNGRTKIDAEKPAVFPLGVTAFKNRVSENFRMRKIISNAEKESCELLFIVDKEGSMVDVKASGSNESFNREAERAVSKIKDKWIPAELNGEKVRYKFRLPLTITFSKK